jgi:hypothetical protein
MALVSILNWEAKTRGRLVKINRIIHAVYRGLDRIRLRVRSAYQESGDLGYLCLVGLTIAYEILDCLIVSTAISPRTHLLEESRFGLQKRYWHERELIMEHTFCHNKYLGTLSAMWRASNTGCFLWSFGASELLILMESETAPALFDIASYLGNRT